ncbi:MULTISPECIES: GlsB/YeaQ/YmgE family stress response membrane protein [unclassified Streptococcus]|uniref:GlsB/YeaQ/YmgE family stress response membrane protein n=1 Tax=unclassified Streptococcus TaxID=2608887 RepID=UPI00359DBBA2
MEFIWILIVGAVIGAIGGAITKKGPSGWIANIVAGIVGSYVGQALFGVWGPTAAGMAIVPSIIGAALVTIVAAYFFGRKG